MNQSGSERVKIFAPRISKKNEPLKVVEAVSKILYPDHYNKLRATISEGDGANVTGAFVYFVRSSEPKSWEEDVRGRGPDILVERGRFRGFYIYLDPKVLRFRRITERALVRELLESNNSK